MAKTYPAILLERSTPMTRVINGVDQQPTDVLVSRVGRSTVSSTSPNYPVNVQENSFMTQTTSFQNRPVYVNSYIGGKLYRNIDSFSGPAFTGAPQNVVNSVEYRALIRLYDKIPEVTANLALLYKERQKTVESITTALSGIVSAVRDVRKGRPPELLMNASQLRNRKRMSGAWLNYTYGIAPFASDLHAIAISELKQIIYLTGKCTDRYESSRLGGKIVNRGSYMCTYKAGLSLSNPLYATLAGAGLTNPALVAWELTPFSFMADWLLPVGPFLEMLSSTSGYNKHPGSITRGTREWCIQQSDNGASAYSEYRRIQRATIAFPSVPLPRFKNPISPVHALNALSIIHQSVKSGQR
jgi:hypothetical protein